MTGEAAGHLLLKDDDDRCFSLASRSFWKLTKADGVWLSATPDENIKINQRIDFSSIWILPCSTCVHIATYRENGRILGIAMGSPPAQTALSFAEPHPLMLHCIGPQSKQFQFLQQTIDAGSSEVTGYWAIAPLMDDKGEWIPPDQAIGEYVVVRDTSRSPLVPIDPKYPAGIDLFAGRSLLSICRAVADPDNRSWQVTAAGRKRLAPNLHTVYAAAQNNLYARSDLDEGPVDGQLVFGRVIQTRPPHGAAGPWTFNPRGAEVLRRTVTTAPAAPATQPTQPPH